MSTAADDDAALDAADFVAGQAGFGCTSALRTPAPALLPNRSQLSAEES